MSRLLLFLLVSIVLCSNVDLVAAAAGAGGGFDEAVVDALSLSTRTTTRTTTRATAGTTKKSTERLQRQLQQQPTFPSHATGNCDSADDPMTVNFGYYQIWASGRESDCHPVSPDDGTVLSTGAYTHLAYSFAWISAANELEPYDGDYDREEPLYRRFVSLKEQAPTLKTLIAVGGWTFSDPGPTERRWTETCGSAENRTRFVDSTLTFLRKYGFDGVDLDWEFPGGGRGGTPGSDYNNYAQLVLDLRAAFDAAPETYVLTMSVPVVRSLLDVGYDLLTLAQGLDFMNLMTYDLHGVWEELVGAHSDLVDIFGYLQYFLDIGVPRSKMVLGLATYGRTYTMEDASCVTLGCPFSGGGPGGCLDVHTLMPYYTIDQDHVQNGDYNILIPYNPTTGTAELVFDDIILVTYDSPESFAVKIDYAQLSCYRGVMWWAADMLKLPFEVSLNPLPPTPINPLPPTVAPATNPTSPPPSTTSDSTAKPTSTATTTATTPPPPTTAATPPPTTASRPTSPSSPPSPTTATATTTTAPPPPTTTTKTPPPTAETTPEEPSMSPTLFPWASPAAASSNPAMAPTGSSSSSIGIGIGILKLTLLMVVALLM